MLITCEEVGHGPVPTAAVRFAWHPRAGAHRTGRLRARHDGRRGHPAGRGQPLSGGRDVARPDRYRAGWSARFPHAVLYILDPEHLLTPLVRQLAAATDELVARIGELCRGWEHRPVWVGIAEAPPGTDNGVHCSS